MNYIFVDKKLLIYLLGTINPNEKIVETDKGLTFGKHKFLERERNGDLCFYVNSKKIPKKFEELGVEIEPLIKKTFYKWIPFNFTKTIEYSNMWEEIGYYLYQTCCILSVALPFIL